MRGTLRLWLGFGCVGVLAVAVHGWMDRLPGKTRPAAGSYTAILEEYSSDGTGPEKKLSTQAWVRRADGALAVHLGTFNGGSSVVRFPDGTQVFVHPEKRMKSTYRGLSPLPERAPESHCALPGETPKAATSLHGHRTAVVEKGNQTTWYALDYSCAPLQTRIDHGGGAYSESRLTQLSLMASPMFFQIDTFQEVPPSATADPAPSCIAECAERREAVLADRDKQYWKNQSTHAR